MIPMLGEVVGIVCNKAMMKEAGLLDENGEIINAETWDDLYDYASKLTKDGQTGLGIDWGSNMMLYTYEACLNGVAGTIFKEDGTTIEYTGDNVKYLLESWKKLMTVTPPRMYLQIWMQTVPSSNPDSWQCIWLRHPAGSRQAKYWALKM